MTDVAVTEVLGESLSPSQVNMYMMCPAKWLPDRIERADHGSIGTRQSVSWNTGTELPPEAEHRP